MNTEELFLFFKLEFRYIFGLSNYNTNKKKYDSIRRKKYRKPLQLK